MKDPAFLFYPGDWLGGTLGMTFEEKGAYLELLMLQFNRGHMEGHVIGQTVGHLWDKIKSKFVQDEDGLWYNVRLEIEQNKRNSYINSRMNNIKGNNQYSKTGHMSGHMTSHMRGHMENENENRIEKERGVYRGERKGKERNIFDLSEVGEDWLPLIERWLQYKSDRKERYKSQDSVMTMVRKLKRISGNNHMVAEQIVEQSMAANWAGLFELKSPGWSVQPSQPGKNKLNPDEIAKKINSRGY